MDKSFSLDRILLEKGLITPEQLTVALQYQCRLPSGQAMSLAEVLVAMEYVTQAQIDEALGKEAPPEDVLIQLLLKEGMVQENQLTEALMARQGENANKRTGTMLLEMGYTTREMIESALTQYYLNQHTHESAFVAQEAEAAAGQTANDEPEYEPLGQKLIRKGLITPEELEDALDYQQRLPRILHKPIGEILMTLGYVDEATLHTVLNDENKPRERSLGDVLVHAGILEQWQLSHAMSLLTTADYQGKKLGHVVVELGYARRPDIEQALKSFYQR